jgi:CubicO group peptidase (beta-lactamase class C family)
MKRFLASSLILSLAISGLALTATVRQSVQTLMNAAGIAARVDDWIQPYVAAGDFSGAVLIAEGDRVLAEKRYGMADFVRGVPNRIGTRFRVASLSKTFTAAAVEILIDRGKIHLSDPLGSYVPGIANGGQITVEQLLSHQSGVGALDTADRYRDCLDPSEWLRRLRQVKPLFAPGKGDQYSNEGYFLLALIVERASGMPYDRFLQENIFGPLGMKDTGSACRELPPGPNAAGHVPGAAPRSVVPLPFNEAVEIGPGSIYSSARDMLAWLRAVDTNEAFSVGRFKYPYGWGRRNYSGRNLIEQSGILEGYDAHMALYPQEHIRAVVLGNIQSGFFNRIPKDLEAVLFGGKISRPPEANPFRAAAQELKSCAGEYATDAIPYHQTLAIQSDALAMRWGEFPFWRGLTPIGKDAFFFRYEYATVRFTRDKAGNVIQMSWQWEGGDPMVFRKLGS